jgi:hypothetical protein
MLGKACSGFLRLPQLDYLPEKLIKKPKMHMRPHVPKVRKKVENKITKRTKWMRVESVTWSFSGRPLSKLKPLKKCERNSTLPWKRLYRTIITANILLPF